MSVKLNKNKNKKPSKYEEGEKPFLSLSEESDSSVKSWMTVGSQSSERSRKRSRSRQKEDDNDQEQGSDSGSDAPATKIAVAPRRSRGRPPTTGQYVGLAKAKEELNRAREEELRLEAERQLAEEQREKMERSRAFFRKDPQDRQSAQDNNAAEIERMVSDSLETIMKVATKSKNLKGTYVAALKDAARVVKDSFQVIRERTMPEEVSLLVEANKKLTEELKEIRREMEELRSARNQVQTTPLASTSPTLEEIMRTVMVQVGTMINARFESMEERLLPEKRLRPPLAADKRREEMQISNSQPTEASTSSLVPKHSLKPGPTKTSKKGKKTASSAKPDDPIPRTASQIPANTEQSWSTVVKRGSKKNKRTPASERTRSSAPKRTQSTKTTSQTSKAKGTKLRPPRTAAVIITLRPEAAEKGITYAKVLTEAKNRINLAALEMPPLKIRAAATGARILEIPGAEKEEKANSLANKLKEVFGDCEEIQVSIPTTTADIRVSGLDDSVNIMELTETLAKVGECPIPSFKVGEIKKGPAGMGTAFVRCPTVAAKKILANGGRLLIGWVAAQVRLLEARPRRCFRCLESGHIGAQCRSEVDRSKDCYRCGKPDHKAKECSADPHCNICEAAGKPAGHLCGGKACTKPPSKTGGRKISTTVKATAKPQTSSPIMAQAEEMEEN